MDPARRGLLLTGIAVLSGCTSGGGSSGDSVRGPAPPASVTMSSASSAVLVNWTPVSGATSYNIYYGFEPGVSPRSAPAIPVASPPYLVQGLPGGMIVYCVMTSVDDRGEGRASSEESVAVVSGDGTQYFPSWANATPQNTIAFDYDPSESSAKNGSDLAAVIGSLQAGDRLEIGAGTYTIDQSFHLGLMGTAQDPIWIVAAAGAKPEITRSNAYNNVVNIGTAGRMEYVCLRGIEITGGDIAILFYDCSYIWIDQCDIHDCANNAIAANSLDVDGLYFTRNEVHDTAGYGEGFYIGANYGASIASNCVIAQNHVYNTGGQQGDGIEIKQGSWGNWVAENVVHDCNYPCILLYGTDGNPPNVVERNMCWGSNDNVMQIQGEAIVRNNVAIGGNLAFFSNDHQASARDLVVVHNTFVNTGHAAIMDTWTNRPGMVFANNACYSQTSTAIGFNGGATGVVVAGNVAYGWVSGTGSGYIVGGGLTDFVDLSWDGQQRDITPSVLGALIGAADPGRAAAEDYYGTIRTAPYDAGAAEAP